MSKRGFWMLIVPILITVSIFYLTTIRPGHNWGGDFSLYIHHAKNIVEGIPYQETGYIYNKNNAYLSPRYYPPIFPLLLTPVYALTGLNLAPMKIEMVIIFILFLILYSLSFREQIPSFYRGLAILLVAFNPIFWEFKENILSEFPFLLFTYLALYAIQRIEHPQNITKRSIPTAIGIGLLIYLSYGIRTVGGILLPTFLLYDFIRTRKIDFFPVVVSLSFGVFALTQAVLIPGPSGYGDQITFSPLILTSNLILHIYHILCFLPTFGSTGPALAVTTLFYILILSAILFGYLLRIKRDFTIYEVFAPFYLLVIVLWNAANQGPRFLLPVYPILIFYLIDFVVDTGHVLSKNKPWGYAVPACIVVLSFPWSYLRYYATANFNEVPNNFYLPQTMELFDYIRNNTPQNAVFIFFKPRVLSLYTDRKASACGVWDQPWQLEECFEQAGMDYIAIGPNDGCLLDYIHSNPNKFNKIFENNLFSLYRYLNTGQPSSLAMEEAVLRHNRKIFAKPVLTNKTGISFIMRRTNNTELPPGREFFSVLQPAGRKFSD